MPTYEFRCTKCHRQTEQVVPMSLATDQITCPFCGYQAVRVYTAPAVHFKGSGFYNTDYKNKGKKEPAKEEKTPQETKKDADKAVKTESK